jgi:cell wall-associated NlpC family hydrolase
MQLKQFSVAFFLVLNLSACAIFQKSTPPAPVPIPPALHVVYPTSTAEPPVTQTPTIYISPKATCTACTLKPTATLTPALTYTTGTVKVEKLDVWDDPANEASYWHRQTQLVTGEMVLILDQKGDWDQVIASLQPSSKDQRGYPGWVRSSGLTPGVATSNSNSLVVTARTSMALASPKAGGEQVMRLYFDTRLPVLSQSAGWVETVLPDGRSAWLPVKDVGILQSGADGEPFGVVSLLATARTLANAPYLWGGTTPDSPDCSGFVYRLFHVYGKTLPRDANDQVLQGQKVTFEQKKPGDLIFYTDVSGGPVTHVGLYLGGAQIMDANPFLGLTIHLVSDMQKWYVFYGVRRVP